ncbi:MAG TPA: glycine cleavage system protein GcvH [Candidatus Korarchaeota archaeon]|nr:glycine cleavage system protein GcvH [Candidatus Korarchaeota archaeon]
MASAEEFNVPEGLYYSKGNMYVKIEGDVAIVGLTDYGQHLAKKIVFIELPIVGDEVSQDEPIGTIESGKWSGPIESPISGKVMEVNDRLEDEPSLLNEDPYGQGWIAKIKPSNLEEELKNLMNKDQYIEFIKEDLKKR